MWDERERRAQRIRATVIVLGGVTLLGAWWSGRDSYSFSRLLSPIDALLSDVHPTPKPASPPAATNVPASNVEHTPPSANGSPAASSARTATDPNARRSEPTGRVNTEMAAAKAPEARAADSGRATGRAVQSLPRARINFFPGPDPCQSQDQQAQSSADAGQTATTPTPCSNDSRQPSGETRPSGQ
jgi:hypothetical protein